MSDQENPRPTKRTIGHDALRIALDHERSCWESNIRFSVWREMGAGTKELTPDEKEIAKERHTRAMEFAHWAMAEFRRTYDSGAGES